MNVEVDFFRLNKSPILLYNLRIEDLLYISKGQVKENENNQEDQRNHQVNEGTPPFIIAEIQKFVCLSQTQNYQQTDPTRVEKLLESLSVGESEISCEVKVFAEEGLGQGRQVNGVDEFESHYDVSHLVQEGSFYLLHFVLLMSIVDSLI